MEVQKIRTNKLQTTQTTQTTKVNRQATSDKQQAHKLQTTQTNRQMDGIFPFLLSAPYLHISVPIFVPIASV